MVHKTIEHICMVQTIIGFDSVVSHMATVPNGAAHQGLIGLIKTTNRENIVLLPIVTQQADRKRIDVNPISLVEESYTPSWAFVVVKKPYITISRSIGKN